MAADDRFTSQQILAESQYRPITPPSASGNSAYLMALGSKPPDFYGWGGDDGGHLSAQDTSLPGQFVQQWKLRVRAKQAAMKEIASSELRRLPA